MLISSRHPRRLVHRGVSSPMLVPTHEPGHGLAVRGYGIERNPVSYPPPTKFERGNPLFAPRTLVDTGPVAVFRAGQVLVTAARHVRSPTRGLVALAHNDNTAEQVKYQPAVAKRAKVKLTKARLLESCFGDGHFASSSSSRCILRRSWIPILRAAAAGCSAMIRQLSSRAVGIGKSLVLMCGMASVLIGPRFANSGIEDGSNLHAHGRGPVASFDRAFT